MLRNKLISGCLFALQLLFVNGAIAQQPADNKQQLQTVNILAGSYFFKPELITLKVNVPVQLTVTQEAGFIPHNISMDAEQAGMKFKLDLTESEQIIRFTPLKTGQYELFCEQKLLFFESHRDKGMLAIINVIE